MNRQKIRDGVEIFPLLVFMALTKFISLKSRAALGAFIVSWVISINQKLKKRIVTNLELFCNDQSLQKSSKFVTNLFCNDRSLQNNSKFPPIKIL